MCSNASVSNSKERYWFYACSRQDRLNLKDVSELFPKEACERPSPDCLVYYHAVDQIIFVFKFGTVVFFNFLEEDRLKFTSLLEIASEGMDVKYDSKEISEEDLTVTIQPGPIEVKFNSIQIPSLELNYLQIIAQVLALSSALEIIEHEVESFMLESERMTGFLKIKGETKQNRSSLLKFIGRGLATRHRIINQLALFSEPDPTWEKEDLYQAYQKLFLLFDIKDRTEKIDKMMQLSGEVTTLLLEILNTRRAEILEVIIIILIVMEVVKAFIA